MEILVPGTGSGWFGLTQAPGIHGGKYSWRRAMLKAHTTEIVWASFPGLENRDVKSIEADLIEALNPTANLIRPIPTKVPQPDATRVFEEFRKTIHSARPTKPSSLHLAVDRISG